MTLIEELYIDMPHIVASDNVSHGIASMEANNTNAAPVCDANGRYVGMLNMSDATMAPANSTCADIANSKAQVPTNATPSAALEILAQTGLPYVAAVAPDGRLAGCIGRDATIKMISHMTGGDEHGASLSVSIPTQDYEMGRVINIVEQTGARVISATTSRRERMVELLITTNATDASDMAAALRRHGMTCTTYNKPKHDANKDVLLRNYEALMAYLQY